MGGVERCSFCDLVVLPKYIMPTIIGRTASKVVHRASFASVALEAMFLSLTNVFTAHQKFATLSSNKPRLKGKMRCIACPRLESGYKKGEKKSRKVAPVDMPNVANSLRLHSHQG